MLSMFLLIDIDKLRNIATLWKRLCITYCARTLFSSVTYVQYAYAIPEGNVQSHLAVASRKL